MRLNRLALTSFATLALLMASPLAHADAAADLKNTASGAYKIDPNHASITFKILHLGFSRYTGRFDKMDGVVNFNSASPEQSSVDITIYPNSIDTNNAKLEEDLRNDKWFDVIKYPTATFRSTKVERTGPTTGKITGDFTLMGVTHTVVLDTTLIGAGENTFMKKPVIGFSATGTIRRSDYGLSNFIPMVSDDVTLEIEAEFDKAE
ncbi:MAG TPA: YceI family protein [Alphaproteobacteria bacterium]|nr:YceI family protein [Alphaproteobacteria bacterium]